MMFRELDILNLRRGVVLILNGDRGVINIKVTWPNWAG